MASCTIWYEQLTGTRQCKGRVWLRSGPAEGETQMQKQMCLSQRRVRWGEHPRTAQHYRHTVEKYAVRDIGVSRRGDAIRRPSILPYTGSQRSSCANGGVSVSQGSTPLQEEQNFSQEKDTCQAYRHDLSVHRWTMAVFCVGNLLTGEMKKPRFSVSRVPAVTI
jgi:hypothetical protein